jgi:flavin reductase (DIM6/NTAB) family NADH-FMN oxidoreductase RutF
MLYYIGGDTATTDYTCEEAYMDYSTVPYTTYLVETLGKLQSPGLLLVTMGADGKANAMTIGWGTIGVIWGKRIMSVLVRPSRYSYTLLEQSDSFTVCVPSPTMRAAIEYCGKYSGRDGDKIAACKLTLLPSLHVRTPGIDGSAVIYECRIVHKTDVVPANLAKDITAYPRGDYHRIYDGEILAVRAPTNAAELL